jgi:acylphosphatase
LIGRVGVRTKVMNADLVRVHVLAGGRVQGVAYRYYAEKVATRLGVSGWVRNLPDGRVEVLAEGEEGPIGEFLARLEEGPRLARVESFEVERANATGEFTGFRIAFS